MPARNVGASVLFVLIPIAFTPLTAFAADELECQQWADIPIPQEDIGNAPEDCSSADLYYGADGHGLGGDYVAARHCAYRERAAGEYRFFGDRSVLLMLYANGQGVSRNIPLAKRFVCEYSGAPAEISGRLRHLDRIVRGDDNKAMDVCDDITSGAMAGACESWSAKFAQSDREKLWDDLQSAWTQAQRDALAELREAANVYFHDSSGKEVDLSGSARYMFVTEAYESLSITFLDDVARIEDGWRPDDSLEDADSELEATYRRVLDLLEASTYVSVDGWERGNFGTVKADDVRTTQLSWFSYREAWVKFATTRYPDTAPDTWRAWLAKARAKALASIVD
jgi:hypothetical protein